MPGAVAPELAAGGNSVPVEHFRSKAAEMRNLAYRHEHGIPYTATTACVDGHCHKVQHSTSLRRKRIDARQQARKRSSSR